MRTRTATVNSVLPPRIDDNSSEEIPTEPSGIRLKGRDCSTSPRNQSPGFVRSRDIKDTYYTLCIYDVPRVSSDTNISRKCREIQTLGERRQSSSCSFILRFRREFPENFQSKHPARGTVSSMRIKQAMPSRGAECRTLGNVRDRGQLPGSRRSGVHRSARIRSCLLTITSRKFLKRLGHCR